jgi:hypothetical protein
MKKTAFRQPGARPLPAAAEEWVTKTGSAAAEAGPGHPPTKPARLTIDLPPELHTRFKTACAQQRTKMKEEVLRFIEQWTRRHEETQKGA